MKTMDGDDESAQSITSGLTGDLNSKLQRSLRGSSRGLSNSGDDDIDRGRNAIDEQEKLVGKETKAIRRLRKIVFGVITVVAIAGSLGAFFLVEDEENQKKKASFREQANEISERANAKLGDAVSSLRSLSKTITASAITQGATFPFYSLPFYDEQVTESVEAAGLQVIIYAPLVNATQQDQWEAFSQKEQQDDPLVTVINGEITNYKNDSGTDDGFLPGVFLPAWQMAPRPPDGSNYVNYNLFSRSSFEHIAYDVMVSKDTILSDMCDFSYLTDYSVSEELLAEHPWSSYIKEPVYESFEDDAPVVGFVVAVFGWNVYFENLLPDNVNGIDIVVNDDCGDRFTYRVDGSDSTYLGDGNQHGSGYEDMKVSSLFGTEFQYKGPAHPNVDGVPYDEYFQGTSKGHCQYRFDVYPTKDFFDDGGMNDSVLYSLVVAIIFVIILALLGLYDFFVTRRQRKLLATASRTHKIVASIFPKMVQDRMLNEIDPTSNNGDAFDDAGRPIADLYVETTVLFADVVGFTAWSSTREPQQVFLLLESIYSEFDKLANKLGVFKIETIGDCYVAVCGLPEPCKDHAVVMTRFARACLKTMTEVARAMECRLGPDTGDLSLRVGLHSGPVTAGVLRGERARFQLFGDTVNTAARMETNGAPGAIQVSSETANLLKAAGKAAWLEERDDKIVAKGKGTLTTYWVYGAGVKGTKAGSNSGQAKNQDDSSSSAQVETNFSVSDKQARLAGWNTDLLLRLLGRVVARRECMGTVALESELNFDGNSRPFDEVVEVLQLPSEVVDSKESATELDESIKIELHKFVLGISSMYGDNAFHCFEHASHVTMSVSKLLARIVEPSRLEKNQSGDHNSASVLHHYTFGITSDPLTQFACVFSALIHDVDHPGVPNNVLITEESPLAAYYENKSIAEQNSIDLAFSMLYSREFNNLRRALMPTQEEQRRFRQLVVQVVLATDIMDKELKKARNERWRKAFAETCSSDSDTDRNRKATIVIEHLIQASDVAHTMQHWHIYRKWNERFFVEQMTSYAEGRVEKDPSESWYEGEIGFFDFYIIPLAKKLKDCGVFGVSSHEYLDYALKNREEWVLRGKEVVAEMMENFSASS